MGLGDEGFREREGPVLLPRSHSTKLVLNSKEEFSVRKRY